MKGVEEALDLLMPAFVPIGTERLALADALGRYLAEDVAARFDLPPFDHSTMDGYAVRARDTEGATPSAPKVLPLSGESRTGGPVAPALAPGCAVRIFTGATLPPGADAVVIQENVKADGALVGVLEAVAPGAWVRARGADLVSGAAAIGRGTRIGAGEIGMLAAQRLSAVTVYRRPRVAVVCTGDELRDVHDADAPGTIVNSNAYALAALVREAGCDPVVLPNVPDDLAATVNALRAALTADVVLTCGGVSVGDYDFVKAAFAAVGVEAGFWKVRVKPGKPLVFGRRGATPVVGLPGNPISAMVTFEVFVRPGLRAMLGDRRPFRVGHDVTLAVDVRHAVGRVELVRARLGRERDGQALTATPHRSQESGAHSSWVDVDALLVLAEERATYAASERVRALLLRDDTGSAVSPFVT